MIFRKALFWMHLVVGLAAGSVILSMALSGILISFEPQIVAWAERDLQSVDVPALGARRLPLDSLMAKAAAALISIRIPEPCWAGSRELMSCFTKLRIGIAGSATATSVSR